MHSACTFYTILSWSLTLTIVCQNKAQKALAWRVATFRFFFLKLTRGHFSETVLPSEILFETNWKIRTHLGSGRSIHYIDRTRAGLLCKQVKMTREAGQGQWLGLLYWLIERHEPKGCRHVLQIFSLEEGQTANQAAVLFSNIKLASAISHLSVSNIFFSQQISTGHQPAEKAGLEKLHLVAHIE
jgi:hypothetical protein